MRHLPYIIHTALRNGIIAVLALLLAGTEGYAQLRTAASDNSQKEQRPVMRSFLLYYVLDRTELDPGYLDNGRHISEIKKYLALSPRIDSITIVSYASPEGPYDRNVWLAEERGKTAKQFLLDNAPEGSSLTADKIRLRPQNENWGGLKDEIEENYHLQNRPEVLRILNANVSDNIKKWRIRNLDNGYTWHYIIENHMPRLRLATWICVWVDPALPAVPQAEPQSAELLTQPALPAREYPVKPLYEKQMILAGRTNFFLPAMNFGVEVPIGRHISIGADYYYPWWLADNNKYCHELLAWFIDGKYWFNRPGGEYEWTRADKLKGHAVGVYGAAGYYDFQWKKSGYQGEFVDFGVDYTFAKPVGRSKWARLEFNVGLGCVLTKARHYTPTSDYVDLVRDFGIKQRYYSFFGPTRAGVSLVLPIVVKRQVKGGEK